MSPDLLLALYGAFTASYGPNMKGSTMNPENFVVDVRNAILEELAAANDSLRIIEDKLNQDPNNWELQGEFETQQQVCLALEGDLKNWG